MGHFDSKQVTVTWENLTPVFSLFTVSANVRLVQSTKTFANVKSNPRLVFFFFADGRLYVCVNRNCLLIDLDMATALSCSVSSINILT